MTTKNSLHGTDMLPPANVPMADRMNLTQEWFNDRDACVDARKKELTDAAIRLAGVSDEGYSTPEYAHMLVVLVLEIEEAAANRAMHEYHEHSLSLNDYIVTHYHG